MTSAARLIAIEVILHDSLAASEEAIVVALNNHGYPVSWVVSVVDVDQQIAIVDALILDREVNRE